VRVDLLSAQPGFLATQEESAKTSAKTFSLQIGTFREMGATPRPRTLRRKSTNCRDFHRISTMRALYLQEARLGVEIGPYLLGFSQWAGDGQNHRHASNAPTCHVKKAHLQVFMEPAGIEPATSCLQSRRSPS
jgi:hypothetical protein